MNQRELSEKLEELALRLNNLDVIDSDLVDIIEELRKLSNENYAPGNSLSWDAVKPKPVVKPKGGFISRTTGKRLPF